MFFYVLKFWLVNLSNRNVLTAYNCTIRRFLSFLFSFSFLSYTNVIMLLLKWYVSNCKRQIICAYPY